MNLASQPPQPKPAHTQPAEALRVEARRVAQPAGLAARALSIADEATVQAVERSVLWYTEGKGEEDLGVHFFERTETPEGLAAAMPEGAFVVRLPVSPLSYEGVIVKVRWCIRVRIFFVSGRDFVSEHVFDLGHIPPALGIRDPLDLSEPSP